MPKQTLLSVVVPGPPDDVAARLKEQTRFQFLPAQGSVLAGGDRLLAGRVGGRGFRVALNQRDFLRKAQAVAAGSLTEAPGGTAVEATIGLPPAFTWLLRIAFLLGLAMAGFGAAQALGPDGAPAFMPLLFGVVTVAMTLGLGWHVSNADAQVPVLEAALRQALGAAPPTGDPQGASERDAEVEEARRRAAAARAAGKTSSR